MLEARLYVVSYKATRYALNMQILDSLTDEINELKQEMEETPLEVAEWHVSRSVNESSVDDYQDNLERMHIA